MKLAKTLAHATAALDFEMPLESGDARYVDLGQSRGTDVCGRLQTLLERQPADRWMHAVFASHRGAGKSTELKKLANAVRGQYFAVYCEANVEMDSVKFSMEDLLLVIARVIEEQMRKRNTPIPAAELRKVEDWFSQVVLTGEQSKSFLAGVQTEAKAEGGIPFVAKLLASLTAGFKVESTHRELVKNTLRKFPGTLMTLVNNLLDAASQQLQARGLRLLLLIDNMDRYDPQVVDELLVQSSDRFKSLRCHMIVTPPIGLVLKAESQNIESVFRCETMPTVKLREPSQGYEQFSGTGREALLDALGRRIDLDRLMPDPAARNRLVSASGGAIRELLELAQDATLDADGDCITLADVNRTLDRRRNRLRDRIDANGWWDTLATLAETKRLDKAPEFLEVVYQRLAFQYNGKVWYDVHPLIAELLEQRQSSTKASGSPKRKVKKS
jgi:hypothetical protein